MEILRATIADAPEILALQKLAYQSEAAFYNNFEIPPLTQTITEINAQFKDHIFLKAVAAGKVVGTVRAYEKEGICYIGRLAVHPDYQGRGLGSDLMKAIEGYFSPRQFELFTGAKSDKNISLYKKLGYTLCKAEKYGHGDIDIIYMGKKA